MADSELTAAIARMMERFGGREKFFEKIDKRYDEFARVWDQDTERIGRVLRAHLATEHFVPTYLIAKNPELGPVDRARLSYAQKIDLLNPGDPVIKLILPGLRLLGQIRNRIAHRLQIELTAEDESAFLAIELFRAMREKTKKDAPKELIETTVDSGIAVLEEFAKFASGLLHAGADPDATLWSEAMDVFASKLPATGGKLPGTE